MPPQPAPADDGAAAPGHRAYCQARKDPAVDDESGDLLLARRMCARVGQLSGTCARGVCRRAWRARSREGAVMHRSICIARLHAHDSTRCLRDCAVYSVRVRCRGRLRGGAARARAGGCTPAAGASIGGRLRAPLRWLRLCRSRVGWPWSGPGAHLHDSRTSLRASSTPWRDAPICERGEALTFSPYTALYTVS